MPDEDRRVEELARALAKSAGHEGAWKHWKRRAADLLDRLEGEAVAWMVEYDCGCLIPCTNRVTDTFCPLHDEEGPAVNQRPLGYLLPQTYQRGFGWCECNGVGTCYGCLIEAAVEEEYGTMGRGYLRKHLRLRSDQGEGGPPQEESGLPPRETE